MKKILLLSFFGLGILVSSCGGSSEEGTGTDSTSTEVAHNCEPGCEKECCKDKAGCDTTKCDKSKCDKSKCSKDSTASDDAHACEPGACEPGACGSGE